MKVRNGKIAIAILMLLSAGFIITLLASAGSDSVGSIDNEGTAQSAVSWSLPDSVSFAGEPLPLGNFDTHHLFHGFHIGKGAGRFFPEIEKILRENGIPDDFKYLACAESDLSNAVSPAGATGFWQIMESTGKEYGMTINREIDDRYNLAKSTQFACNYFRKAYERYGSWTMAAASYNNGFNGLSEQVEIQKETGYYDLLLNDETARYVFRVVALKLIMSDPLEYGLDIGADDIYRPVPYREVTVDTAVTSFEQFARHFDTNYKILKYLNPWLRKPFLTNSNGREYVIRVPDNGARISAGL